MTTDSTESARARIEIEDLREAGEDGGDLMGYHARGHHDRFAFAEACNKRNGDISHWDRRHVREGDVRHAWWRTVPIKGSDGLYAFHDAEPKSRGAYAVTVWDGIAAGDFRESQRLVREHYRGRCNGIAEGVNWAFRYVERFHGIDAADAMIAAYRVGREKLEGDPA